MDIAWFDRFAEGFESKLLGTCDIFAELIERGMMEIEYDRLHKHPRILLIINEDESEEGINEIPICCDLHNVEIYTSIRGDNPKEVRLIFETPEDLIDHLHSFVHQLIDDEEDMAM
ncbi:hypothetical protein QTG56_25850 (plasmid) [Rossellomorea sp. AcN35-11]|nr:hypothetical protein [Rossellomorea aquimaris]WJV32041.1 hypothetical protein QTG56_25850 [Rossellomorea sp. AcN35-11]